MIKVSIIIPVYNMEAYLRECLDSVLSQTLREIEAVCIDDGSTDSSPTILAEYAARDPRVKVISQKNAGSGPARNAGIAESKGEWLMFLDPDDFFSAPDTVERLYDAVRDSGLQVARGRVFQVGPDGKTSVRKAFSIPMDWPPAGRRSYYEFQSPAGFCQCIYARRLIIGNGIEFPSFRRCQDPAFFISAMAVAREFMQVDVLVINRRNGYKTKDKRAARGLLGREIQNGQLLAIDIARRNGFEKIVDVFGRITGRSRESLFSRMVRRLCAVGDWVQTIPSAEYVNAFFGRFDTGEFHDANLFKLILRVMTAPRRLRRSPERALILCLRKAKRNGALDMRAYSRKRRILLRLLLLMGALAKASADRSGTKNEERR